MRYEGKIQVGGRLPTVNCPVGVVNCIREVGYGWIDGHLCRNREGYVTRHLGRGCPVCEPQSCQAYLSESIEQE